MHCNAWASKHYHQIVSAIARMLDANFNRAREALRVSALRERQARAHGRERDGALTELGMGDREHERAVDAAGKTHEHGVERAYGLAQEFEFLFGGGGHEEAVSSRGEWG